MSPVAEAAAIDRSAKVLAGHTGPVVVHLRYDGTLPPTEVFEELRRRGWSDAHPSPPPARAIDWSRPDVDRGLRYSLRPFQAVTTASFDGTPAQRTAAAAWVRSVLERTGFGPETAPAAASVAERVVESPDPGSVRFELAVATPAVAAVRAGAFGAVRIVDEWDDTVVTEVTFRGNRSESSEPVVRFVVEVAAAAEHDFVAALSQQRVVDVHRV